MDIKEEICSWIGKRWIHGQALKTEGADCIQFIIAVSKEVGWLPKEYKSIKYAKDWAVHNDRSILKEELTKYCTQIFTREDNIIINIDKLQIGDIILMLSGKTSGHAGFYIGESNIVHSHIRNGICKESLTVYIDKIDSVWRFTP